MDKAALRAELQQARRARTSSPAEDEALVARLHEEIVTWAQRQERSAVTVAIYLPTAEEPGSLTTLLSLATRSAAGPAVRLLAPRCHADFSLTWAEVTTVDDTTRGRFGIAEPRADLPTVALDVADIILVPALALSPTGCRLGKGAGYYDRALAALPQRPLLIGVVHDEEIRTDVVGEAHDVPVHVIITAARRLSCHADL